MDIRLAVTQTYFIMLLICLFKLVNWTRFNCLNWAFNLQFYSLWNGWQGNKKKPISTISRAYLDAHPKIFRPQGTMYVLITEHRISTQWSEKQETRRTPDRHRHAPLSSWTAYLSDFWMRREEAWLCLLPGLVGHHHSGGVARTCWGEERLSLHRGFSSGVGSSGPSL